SCAIALFATLSRFFLFFFLILPPPPCSTLFPYTTLFRSLFSSASAAFERDNLPADSSSNTVLFSASLDLISGKEAVEDHAQSSLDRKSTRLNSSHLGISYAVFCLKKKKRNKITHDRTETI